MNIIEAIKSGKRFRPKLWIPWLIVVDNSIVYASDHTAKLINVSFICEDFELESEKIEITKEQLEKAWDKNFKIIISSSVASWAHSDLQKHWDHFCKELGFKE